MANTLDGFPFWKLTFDKHGSADAGALDAFVAEVTAQGLSDLFIFSHGWNNDETAAMSLYTRFFAEVRKLLDDPAIAKRRADATIGVAGVVWPSILWPDDAPADGEGPEPELPRPAGGSVAVAAKQQGLTLKTASLPEISAAMRTVYDAPQQALIAELMAMLEARESSTAGLRAFQHTLGELLASEADLPATLGAQAPAQLDPKHPDGAERGMVDLDDAAWKTLLERLDTAAQSRGATPADQGGAAGLGDVLRKAWNGAKDAVRVATYWQMKQRAGVVGQTGLGPLVARLAAAAPGLRVHLLGHSFGARLVSYSLAGLPDGTTGASSPVKSLFLLQGAFSHNAFSDQLPFDAARAGALKGMAARVDGPLLTTQSLRDYAVGVSYPAASMVNREDASALSPSDRWGAVGHDGMRAATAPKVPLGRPGTAYELVAGQWLNLDGNDVIKHGHLPSGAHSDIVGPETAWAALAGAGVV